MEQQLSKFKSFYIWACVTLFYCYQSVLRPLPNLMIGDLMQDYGISAADFGSYASIYYIGYNLVHIPIGVLIAKFGGRTVIPICILITSSSLIPIIYSDSWDFVYFGRFITGVGSSGAIIGALQIFKILSPNRLGTMIGYMAFFGLMTSFLSGGPLGAIIDNIGLKCTLEILLYSGVFLAAGTYLILPKSFEILSKNSILDDLKAIFSDYRIIVIGICGGLMVGPLEGFADAWGASFVSVVYNIETNTAASIATSVFLGMSVGSLLIPPFSDKTKSDYGILIFSAFSMIICFCFILYTNVGVTTLYVLCTTVGIFSAYQVITVKLSANYVSKERSAMAASVSNMIVMIFGSVFHTSIGFVLDKSWDGKLVNGVREYSADNYVTSISIIPMAMVLAIIILIWLRMKVNRTIAK